MSDSSPPDVLIIASDDSTLERCPEWVDDLPCRVFLVNESVPNDVGVIKINLPGFDEDNDCGVSRPGVDVNLPADVSRRELRTTCRLMIEIVRLRRSLRSADRVGQNLKKAALTDPLTELPNRRDWQETLQRRLAQASQKRLLCLAIVDLDHFKQVNTAHGHAVGDQVLKQVAISLRCWLRDDDFVARLGGDEFGLLFWITSSQFATNVVDRIRESIGRLVLDEFAKDESSLKITASAGYCMATDNISPATFYSSADAAMHSAKRQGRNRSVAHDS